MTPTPLGLRRIKVVALAVTDLARAHAFYAETLSLPPAEEGGELVGYLIGDAVLMLKADPSTHPGAAPYPRITLEVDDAQATARALGERGIALSDPVQDYDGYPVGGFLDSEGNKLWFCSAPPA